MIAGTEFSAYLWSTTALTLRVALIGTLVIAPLGISLGYVLARRQFRGKSVVQTLVALPMVLPPVAVGLVLLLLLGRTGPIGGLLHDWGVELVFTWWAAALAAGVMSFPLLVRSCEAAFAEVPTRLEQVALTLGASPMRTFFVVTLPLARRGVLYGLVLAFSRALGEFGATMLIAGNIPGETTTLAIGIFSLIENGHESEALILMSVSAIMAFVSILSAELWLRRGR